MSGIIILGNDSALQNVEKSLSDKFGASNISTQQSLMDNGISVSIDNKTRDEIIAHLDTIEGYNVKTNIIDYAAEDILCAEITQNAETLGI